MIIKIMRHALSGANTGAEDTAVIPDHKISLMPEGIALAKQRGQELRKFLKKDCAIFSSPSRRTLQTTANVLVGAGIIESVDDELPSPMKILQDPRLREVEHGHGGQAQVDAQKTERDRVGYFYYQLKDGESPARAYDRCSGFLESFMRQMHRKKKKKALVVFHGLSIRIFVMRFFHLTVEQFDMMENPHNCDVITIGPKNKIQNPQFTSGRWAVTGLRLIDRKKVSLQ